MEVRRDTAFQAIQFNETSYLQFLHGQGVEMYQLKELTIHFKGGSDREDTRIVGYFVEDSDSYIPSPIIVLYPDLHEQYGVSLNDTLLEETGHFIQWATGYILFSDDSVAYADKPEEIDAKEFTQRYRHRMFIKQEVR